MMGNFGSWGLEEICETGIQEWTALTHKLWTFCFLHRKVLGLQLITHMKTKDGPVNLWAG